MYISDRILEKILDYYKVLEPDRTTLIDSFRDMQLEYMLKNFFVWYETHKSPYEQKLLTKITEKFDRTEAEANAAMKQFSEIMSLEIEHNGQLRAFLEKREAQFLMNIIGTFSESTDFEANLEIAKEIFKDLELIYAGINAGAIPEIPDNPYLTKAMAEKALAKSS